MHDRQAVAVGPAYRHRSTSALGLVGAVLLVSLQYDSIPLDDLLALPVRANVIPLATFVALLALPLALRTVPFSPVLTAAAFFFCFVLSHSLVALLIELSGNAPSVRVLAWSRQAVALTAGFGLFLVTRRALAVFSNQAVARLVLIGAIPGLAVAVLNFLWGALGQRWAGAVVIASRELFVPNTYISHMRATGLSFEPYSFALFMALIIAPIIFFRLIAQVGRNVTLAFSVAAAIGFIWTFSSTGMVVLAFIILAGLLFGPRRRFFLGAGATAVAVVTLFLLLFPVNQIAKHAINIAAGGTNDVSFMDRFYGSASPFITVTSSWTAVGYGLGGTATHFNEIVPEVAQAHIRSAKWDEMPSLAMLVGRVFAEAGVIGFSLLIMIFAAAFHELRILLRETNDATTRAFLASARLGLWGTAIAATMGFGSFHSVYLWFWISLVDSRYLRRFEAMRQFDRMSTPTAVPVAPAS